MKIIRHRGEVGWSLWLCWMLATVAGAVIGWGLDRIYYSPINDLVLDTWDFTSNIELAGIVVAQWLVLRWWFSRSFWWVLATVLGMILYGLLISSVSTVIGIVLIGSVLWFWQRQRLEQGVSYLMHRRRWGWPLLWALVSAVGFAVKTIAQLGLGIAMVLLFGDKIFGDENFSFFGIVIGVAAGFLPILLFGIITGTALVWLLRRPLPPPTAP